MHESPQAGTPAQPSLRAVFGVLMFLAALMIALVALDPFGTDSTSGEQPAIVQQPEGDDPAAGASVADPPALPEGSRDQSTPRGRNLIRLSDLIVIEGAIFEYRQQNGELPDTGGNFQTLCTYVDIDAGCDIREVMAELPSDPTGANIGYFYRSDGGSYTIASVWEGDITPPTGFECPEDAEQVMLQPALVCRTDEAR